MAIFMLTVLAPETAHGWWRPRLRNRAKPKVKPRLASKKTYRYIRNHDLNYDGKVDNKDRLIWIRNKKGNYSTIFVSDENEDLAEIMDMDGDGDVEAWEMKQFYLAYDLNQNGLLEDKEIEAALD